MGCTASKDGVETIRKSHSAQTGRSMSMPVQAQGKSDNGFHMVALTSSTYGILKVDTPKMDGNAINAVSISNSSQDAFYEKLKHFDVPDEMVTKPWSEVSRNLPKIPPPTRTDSPRRTDSLRRMDSPRQTRGMDSPRQRGSFQRTRSPRRLPSHATRNDHDTINMWELMDGLEEDRSTLAKPKLKPVERIPGSPVIKPFERSVTFSTIHTLSELDSGDPSKAIAPGPAGNFLSNSQSVDGAGKENANPVRVMWRSASSPIVPKREEIKVRLTPSSPSPVPRAAAPSSDPSRPRQPTVTPMALTPAANATIREVSNAVSKSLLPPPSPLLRSVGTKQISDSPRPRQPTAAPMTVRPEVNATLQEGSNAASKSLLPPPSPLLRSVGTKQISDSSRPRQPAVAPMTVAPEVNATSQEGSNAASKSLLPPPSPLLRSVGTQNASVTQGRSRPAGLQHSISPMVKAIDSPMSLNTKLEAEIERAISEERGVSTKRVQPTSTTATTALEPDSGRVPAVATSLSQEGAGSRPQHTPRRVEVNETSNQPSRQLPRFASPIHVLSLAASFDLENRKNSMSHIDLKAPPMSPGPTMMKAGGLGQSGRQSFSKQQSMPSPSLRVIPSSDQGVSLQSQASAPNPSSHGSRDASNASEGFRKDSLLLDNDLSSSYVHLSGDGNLRTSKGAAAPSAVKGFSKGIKSVSQVREDIPAGKSPAGASERDTNTNTKSSLGDTAMNSDLLASFEEALEMFSTDEWYNRRDSKGAATSVSGFAENNGPSPMDTHGISSDELEEGMSGDKGRQGNGNMRANAHLATQGEAIASKSSAPKGTAFRKIVKPDPWARFEMKCPPAGEDRVVLYTTSLRGIRKTFEDCNNARFIFGGFNIEIDERDVSIHAEFRQELKELAEKPVPVPQAFIKGRYIGGMDIITQLHEDGTLATLVDGLPPQLSRGECDGCGGVRFVPCSDCSGSTKVVNEAKEVVRCSECNENGLMRCPICY